MGKKMQIVYVIVIFFIGLVNISTPAQADTLSATVTIVVPPGGGGIAVTVGPVPTKPPPQLRAVKVYEMPLTFPVDKVVEKLQTLPDTKLADIPIVAKIFGVKDKALILKHQEIAPVIREQMQVNGLKLNGALKGPLELILPAVSLRNPELSTARGMEGFVRDVMAVSSNGVIVQAMENSHKAEIFTKMVTSMALGTPLDRRTFDKDFYALGKVLLEREKEVVQKGEFQKFFNRNPKKTEEWKVVKVVAYRGRSLPQEAGGERSLVRETIARKRYERVFKVNLATLVKSTNPADQGRVAQAWSMIRAVAASKLRIQ